MAENAVQGKRSRKMIWWSIIYVLFTYLYPVFWYLTIPKDAMEANSEAEYEVLARAQNGSLGSALPWLSLTIPFILLILNIIFSIAWRNSDRKTLLVSCRIIKYALIPYYLAGGFLIFIFFLLIFTPVVIMIFVSPPIIAILSFIGWISMAGGAPTTIAYLVRGVKDKKHSKTFAIIVAITQFFYGADFIGLIVCEVNEKRRPKTVAAPVPQITAAPEHKEE